MKQTFLLYFLVLLFFVPAFANDKKNKDTLEAKIQPIYITAMKYPELLIEIPMAVTKISSSDIINIKGFGIDEVLNRVPGVLVQSRTGGIDSRITIRGFGARGAGDRSNAGTSRGIKVLIDGTPETEPDGRTAFDNIDFGMVSNIEVLRSNSSSLWGNAAGGVVNISTIPNERHSFVNISEILGSYGFNKISGQAGLKLENGLVYLMASNTKFDGWRQWSDGERTLINVGFNSELSDLSNLSVLLSLSDNKFNIAGPLSLDEYNNNPEIANSTYFERKERRHNQIAKLSFNYDLMFDEYNTIAASAFLNPKYLQRSERNTYRDFTRYHLGQAFNYKNSLDITDNFHNIFLVGFDNAYQDGAILFYNLTPDGNRGSTLRTNKKEGANTFGIFIQDEVKYNDVLSLLLGIRYDKVTYFNQDFMQLNRKDEMSFEKSTPKIGLSYRVTPEMSLYFNIGGGIEVPAGNETDPVTTFGQDSIFMLNPLLKPILSSTYEFGLKNYDQYDGFINQIHYDVALFMINFENEIVPYSGGKFYFSVAESRRLGAELGFDIGTKSGLSFGATFTYMNSKYLDYKIDSVHYDKSKEGIFADYSNNKTSGVPDYFYNFRLKFAPEWSYNLYIELSNQGVSGFFVDDANLTQVDAYSIFNSTIGMSKAYFFTKNIGLKLFFAVNNLLDTKYTSSAFINPDRKNGVLYYIEPGLPRNFHLGFNLEFK